MTTIFENTRLSAPRISLILLDWSCRESFHTIEYLNSQTVPRHEYEIIWIEYYDRRPAGIAALLEGYEAAGRPSALDKWLVISTPKEVCYHKHLMYNVGIIAARSPIVAFCDSDAIMAPTFVESILESFEREEGIVLHLDEVRNVSKRFYPFNRPSIDEIKGRGCVNWDGKTTMGLAKKEDPIHALNYGACMCARKHDLVSIGGADEHIDYLGHICGPYEMTFRLANSGRKEVWREDEFLYHVWHPGTDGKDNHMGPHDGRNVSLAALEAKRSGRVLPLQENPAIRMMRLKEDAVVYEPLLEQAIPSRLMEGWRFEKLNSAGGRGYFDILARPLSSVGVAVTFVKMLARQLHMKAVKFSRDPKSLGEGIRKAHRVFGFLGSMARYNAHVVDRCSNCLKNLAADGVKEFALCGTGDIAEVLYRLAKDSPVKISAVYGYFEGRDFFGLKVTGMDKIGGYNGKVVVAALASAEETAEGLKHAGLEPEKIVFL